MIWCIVGIGLFILAFVFNWKERKINNEKHY